MKQETAKKKAVTAIGKIVTAAKELAAAEAAFYGAERKPRRKKRTSEGEPC